MSLDKSTVARIANLARIEVPESDLEPLAGELSSILTWIEQLSEVDVEGVQPMTSVAPMNLKQREDEVTDGGRAADVVANAPETVDGYFLVPKVIE
ncbi:MAG: Asp-tRNA(Asn)/Glu-tRNA(Gln) amidotransferase GatCAB subunit C [Rhodospirillaceae bacterium]|nr:Asp-tRNA(Asn)/Glu-tRNA(Gln) amidotransferase GatCAB subunit C [Rhodospirillaceae bacterium]|tara:strand:+ start:489 stop:776 length:288 start_codon:yes stop_codon:yes gene_type:complete